MENPIPRPSNPETDQRRNVGNSSTAAAQANVEESSRAQAASKPDAKPSKPKDDPSLAPESGDKLDADKDL